MFLANKLKFILIFFAFLGFFIPCFFTLAAPTDYVLLEPTLVNQNNPGTTIGGLTTSGGATGFAAYFQLLYSMMMAVGVLACIFYFVWGGFRIMVSTVPGVKQQGKEDIYRSLEGLAFILGAYLILNTINPRLTHINLGLIQINSTATNDNIFSPNTNNVYNPPPPIQNPCSGSGAQKNTAAYVIANEGWKNSRYTDSLGNPTIGVGHHIQPGENIPSQLTDQEVSQLFQSDYALHQQIARQIASANGVNLDSLSPNRQTVLIDMTFNIRNKVGDFQNMWSAIQAGDWNRAGNEILNSDYARQVGNRAAANADIMKTDNDSYINQRISGDSHAKNYCQ